MPQPKEQISIRLDSDVLEHFRRYPRYQTRINAILRAAMEHEKRAGPLDAAPAPPQTAAKRA
jgi:BrnA antitoxin of type II toxin-antitoxin system